MSEEGKEEEAGATLRHRFTALVKAGLSFNAAHPASPATAGAVPCPVAVCCAAVGTTADASPPRPGSKRGA